MRPLKNQYLANQRKISELIDLGRRQVALATIGSNEVMKRRYLHFEGKTDCMIATRAWFEMGDDCGLAFVNSNDKPSCIKNHSSMVDLGFKVQSIVDMDHDFEDFCLLHIDGSESIRSTSPYATLLTMMSDGYCEELASTLVEWCRIGSENESSFDYNLLGKRARAKTLEKFERTVKNSSWKGVVGDDAYRCWKNDLKKWFASGVGRFKFVNDHSFIQVLHEMTKNDSKRKWDAKYNKSGSHKEHSYLRDMESEYRKVSVDLYGKKLYFFLKDIVSKFDSTGTSLC